MRDLIKRKNILILELQRAKQVGDRSAVDKVSREAADCEAWIASEYLRANRPEDAVISMISQASCLMDGDYLDEAIGVLRNCVQYTGRPETIAWIHAALEGMGSPASRRNQEAATKPFEAWWAARLRRSLYAWRKAIQAGAKVLSTGKLEETSSTYAVLTRPCNYAREYWRVPLSTEVADMSDAPFALECLHCRHVLSKSEERGSLEEETIRCSKCHEEIWERNN